MSRITEKLNWIAFFLASWGPSFVIAAFWVLALAFVVILFAC